MAAFVDEADLKKHVTIFVAEQRPFDHDRGYGGPRNTFCVLVPLMTMDGKKFGDAAALFPNRGRAWWMLTAEQKREEFDEGDIVCARISNSPRFEKEPNDPRSDRYQADNFTLQRGAGDWVEVVDVDLSFRDFHVHALNEPWTLDRRPTQIVFVRGADFVVGPLRADPHPDLPGKVWFESENTSRYTAYRADRDFLRGDAVATFDYDVKQWPMGIVLRSRRIVLARRTEFARLRDVGTEIDFATPGQTIAQVLKHCDIGRDKRQRVRDLLAELPIGSPGEDAVLASRIERFREYCGSAEMLARMSDDIVAAVEGQPIFAEIVEKNVDRIAKERIEEEVRRRSADVAVKVEALDTKKRELEIVIADLEQSFDRAKAEQEARLAAEHKRHMDGLAEREKTVAAAEALLADHQRAAAASMKDVIDIYETKGNELASQVVALLPLLSRVGGALPATGIVASGGTSERRTSKLALPTWLGNARAAAITDERSFIEQFEDTVARRGFVYRREDLLNFHISLKAEIWTVLCGPSGQGKSSLPRLYSEALGAKDEYLSIPVRPDWLDDRDILGSWNSISGRYETRNGFIDRLIAAHEDEKRGRGGLYVICLDEMNLARVEHYFAQLLSVLENAPGERVIDLFPSNLDAGGDAYAPYRELPIGANVRFVGTINMDETTQMLSPKVIDRTQIALIEPTDLKRAPEAAARAKDLGQKTVHLRDWLSWIGNPDAVDASAKRRIFEVDECLKTMRCGLSRRVFRRIVSYLASARGLMEDDVAMDFAVAQNVLPRIRPRQDGFEEAIDGLLKTMPKDRFPRSGRLIEELRDRRGEYDYFQLL